MIDPSTPSQPRHREKLLDLKTGESVSTGGPLLSLSELTTRPEGEERPSVAVHPVGEKWAVESDGITLEQAATQQEAEELGAEVAKDIGADRVAVLSAEGAVEKEVKVGEDSPNQDNEV